MCEIQNYPELAIASIHFYNKKLQNNYFLDSIQKTNYTRFLIVLINNCSDWNEIRLIEEKFPNSRIIRSEINMGFSAGYNLAIKYVLQSGISYLMIHNFDIKLHPDCISKLMQVLKGDTSIGAVGPILFYSDEPNKVQMYGGSIDIATGIGKHDYNGVTDLKNLPPIRDAQYLDGGTMLIRADVLRKVGGFDEKLFMYYEDSDLCVRIQRAGYRTVVVRDAWAWHYHRKNKGNFSPPYEIYYITRNRFYFICKHAGGGLALRAFIGEIIKAPRKVLFFLKHLKPVLAIAYLKGLLDGILFRMGKRGFVN